MEKDVKQKKSRYGLLLIILGFLLTVAGAFSLLFVQNGYDYIIPAPEISAEMPVSSILDKLNSKMDVPWAASLRQQGVPVYSSSGSKQNSTATLYAVSEGFFDLFHETLSEGRLLNRVDLENDTIRALINRKGAESLFAGGNVLGKSITAEGQTIEIVGILEGGFVPGEADEILVYIPITAANKGSFHFRTLEIKTLPSRNEEKAQIAASLKNWQPGGTIQDTVRSRLAALMPLWLIACAAGFFLLRILFSRLTGLVLRQRDRIKEALQEQYASRVALKAFPRCLLLLLMFACWLFAVWMLLSLIVMPLYTFTDWIPSSPADPASVIACVKNLLTASASSAVYKNRAAASLEASACLIRAGSLILLVGLIPFRRRKAQP